MSTVDGATTPVRLPKASELVVGQLRRRIIRGELAEGAALPSETELMSQFGVSRPTLREAFRVLESENLIVVKRGSRGGARVKAPDAEVAARYAGLVLEHRGTTLGDVFEAAAIIETPCVGLLARSGQAADVTALRELVEREEAATGPGEILEAQVAFHRAVIELCGNATLGVLAAMVRTITDTASRHGIASEGRSERQAVATHQGSKTHHRVVNLIAAQDVEGAQDLWRRHLVETSRHLERSLGATSVLDLLD